MKTRCNQPAVQPLPQIPGLTRCLVRAHAARLFRDVFAERQLSEPEWRLAEEDLARKLERDGF